MRWMLLAAVIPMLVACGGAGPLKPQATTTSRSLESAVVREMNVFRRGAGKSPLREEAQLDAIARGQSQFLSQHTSDRGIHRSNIAHANASERFAGSTRVGFRMIGENVYSTTYGGSEDTIAKKIAQGWWGSPPHRKNMLLQCDSVGVGIVRGANGATFATAIFASQGGGMNTPSYF